MRYRIRAVSADAAVVETDLEAGSESEARALASARGLSVLSLRRQGRDRGRRGRFPLLLFNQELLALLRAGIPLAEALEALHDNEGRGAVRGVLDGIRTALNEGRTFSSALAAAPHAFPELYVAIMRAAERTSDLESALERYIAYQQQLDTLRGKLVGAAIYPTLLLAVGGVVILFLLGYVVPRFAHIFDDLTADLPFLSRVLLDWGQAVQGNALWIAIAVVAGLVGLSAALRSAPARAAMGRAAWRIPAIGRRLRVFELARFYRTLGMLLAGGMPAVTALGMVSGLLSPALRDNLQLAIELIREGRGFTATLAQCGLATRVAQQMLTIGERSGSLGNMLTRAAEFHEDYTAREIEWVTRLFGPLLMLFIGCSIGLIIVLMYLPIFQLAEVIG